MLDQIAGASSIDANGPTAKFSIGDSTAPAGRRDARGSARVRSVPVPDSDELIAEVRGAPDFGPLVLHPLVGGMPVDEAWKSVHLLFDAVLPALRRPQVFDAPATGSPCQY